MNIKEREREIVKVVEFLMKLTGGIALVAALTVVFDFTQFLIIKDAPPQDLEEASAEVIKAAEFSTSTFAYAQDLFAFLLVAVVALLAYVNYRKLKKGNLVVSKFVYRLVMGFAIYQTINAFLLTVAFTTGFFAWAGFAVMVLVQSGIFLAGILSIHRVDELSKLMEMKLEDEQ